MLNKYHSYDFGNGFEIHDSILDVAPYSPEVLFIGTYNHNWSWNHSDFFYGRGMYMWPILANLFLFNENKLSAPRNTNCPNPTLMEIFEICSRGKLSFANIVKGIRSGISILENPAEKYVTINGQYKWRKYADDELEKMAKNDWLDDNAHSIVNYINDNRSIKFVYFTFKSGKWLNKVRSVICTNLRDDLTYCSIFTPTAKGFGYLLDSPYNKRAWGLTHCWIWNGLGHHTLINKAGYGHFDHLWLRKKGVEPDKF